MRIILDGNPDLVENDEFPEINITFTNVIIAGEGERGYVLQNAVMSDDHGPRIEGDNLIQADAIGGKLDVPRNLMIELPEFNIN